MKKRNMNFRHLLLPLVVSVLIVSSCSKPGSGTGNPDQFVLSYGDSIIYPQEQQDDYIIYPLEDRPGEYEGFPDGIEIDEETGAINVSDSETGLRYRITHTAPNGTVTTTMVVLSGITYFDKFYFLNQGDSIANPIYNASASRPLPVQGSSFDEGNLANNSGCDVRTDNGKINLAQTVRNGLFGTIPQNDDRDDIDIEYRLNDESGRARNRIRVRLYYYETMDDVPADLWETLNEREAEGVFLGMESQTGGMGPGTERSASTQRTQREARPRPPCVIIIGGA